MILWDGWIMSEVFVFGSNKAGRHGKGAAQDAVNFYGAKYGVGEGLVGSSYAIPTKDEDLNVLSLDEIGNSIWRFLEFAKANPKMKFHLTPVGCGLAGYSRRDIWAILQKHGVPENVLLTSTWVTP